MNLDALRRTINAVKKLASASDADVMPRLHQDTCRSATCIPDEQLVSGYIYVCWRAHIAGYMLLVRDTCWLYLGDIITIHLCHGRLASLCIRQHVSWCKRGCNSKQAAVWCRLLMEMTLQNVSSRRRGNVIRQTITFSRSGETMQLTSFAKWLRPSCLAFNNVLSVLIVNLYSALLRSF